MYMYMYFIVDLHVHVPVIITGFSYSCLHLWVLGLLAKRVLLIYNFPITLLLISNSFLSYKLQYSTAHVYCARHVHVHVYMTTCSY